MGLLLPRVSLASGLGPPEKLCLPESAPGPRPEKRLHQEVRGDSACGHGVRGGDPPGPAGHSRFLPVRRPTSWSQPSRDRLFFLRVGVPPLKSPPTLPWAHRLSWKAVPCSPLSAALALDADLQAWRPLVCLHLTVRPQPWALHLRMAGPRTVSKPRDAAPTLNSSPSAVLPVQGGGSPLPKAPVSQAVCPGWC